MYIAALKVALLEVQNENPLYDFITAVKGLNPIFAGSYKIALEEKISRNTEIPSIFDLIETFRNHIRINRAVSRAPSHTAFATLQEQLLIESSTESPQSQPSRTSSYRPCLCSDRHRYSECSYLNIHARPS